MSDVLSIGQWNTNAELIADVAQLGYITGNVLDLTYGEGKFWTLWRPEDLTTNDLDRTKPARHHFNATHMPAADQDFETVVFDPPYRMSGKRDLGGGMDGRYGTTSYMSKKTIFDLLRNGTTEACRLSSRWVLVKCQDQVNGSRMNWQTDEVTTAARAAGFRKADSFHLLGIRPQPPGRRQLHARHNYSTLLVFERVK